MNVTLTFIIFSLSLCLFQCAPIEEPALFDPNSHGNINGPLNEYTNLIHFSRPKLLPSISSLFSFNFQRKSVNKIAPVSNLQCLTAVKDPSVVPTIENKVTVENQIAKKLENKSRLEIPTTLETALNQVKLIICT